MAKKYLLYIHNDKQFDEEMYKSELVNRLLKEHWTKLVPGDYVAPIEDIEELKDDLREEEAIFDPRVPPGQIHYIPKEALDFKPCKHNAHPGYCKFAKPGKPCK